MRSNTWPLYFLMSSNHSLFFTCRWFGSCVGPVFLHKVSGLVWSGVSACQIGWTGAAKVTTLCQHHVQLHWDVEVNKHTLMFSVKPQKDFIELAWNDFEAIQSSHAVHLCTSRGQSCTAVTVIDLSRETIGTMV